MRTLAVVGCSQVVTLRGPARPRVGGELRELGIIDNGGILVGEGRIAKVGVREEIERAIEPDTEVIDGGGRILLPGFVDAHTHAVFAGNRVDDFALRAGGASYGQIAASGGGIRSTAGKTRAASEEELFEAASRYREWFVRSGTTTVEAKSGYGLTLEDEMKMLRVIRRLGYVPTFLGAHEVPDEFRGRRGEYVRSVVNEMLPRVASERLAEYCDVFSEPSVFPIEDARTILRAARRLGLGLRIHADQLEGSGGAGLAAELRAATADHLEHTEPGVFAALREAGVQPVLLPASVYTLGSHRFADARAMIEAGLAVVLATDFNPGSAPTPSIPMVLSIACTQMKMHPSEAISAVTVNASWSLGRGQEAGTLEEGKVADFVLHDCSDYRELAYFFGVEHAHAVFAGGKLVFQRC
ncbi:MAG: imidazolonepropionase [Acidobacteria bacterium]|nr:imidazolonepropionase [Acidobacteriota bacterium]